MSVYRVTGRLPYRGHEPNSVFEATLHTGAEHRAVARGAISLITSSTPSLQPGSYRLPVGWPPNQEEELGDA